MKKKQSTLIRITTALLLLLLAASALLTACGRQEGESAPLTVNGTPVDDEVFRYYLDKAFGELTLSDRAARINAATQQCIRYVAVNTTFQHMGLSLTPAERAQISEESNALWRNFGAHYEKIGVSKTTFVKLHTSAAYTEKLRLALYDENGAEPIPEEQLKAYFDEHYAAVRYMEGFLYTTDAAGEKKTYDDETLKSVFRRFEQTAEQINAGAAAELMFASLSSSVGIDMQQHLDTEVVFDGAPGYPRTFYEAVCGMPKGKAGVLVFEDHIYAAQREDILSDPALFKKYRETCLKAVSETPLQTRISQMCEGFASVRKTRIAQECYAAVAEGRR